MKKRIYLDYAATTPVKDEVLSSMKPYFFEHMGDFKNPVIQSAINESTLKIAQIIHAAPHEIFFTSSGSDGNNILIRGLVHAQSHRGKHLLVSEIEHASVLNVFKALEKEGYEVSIIPVDRQGVIDLVAFKSAIRPDTIFASVMFFNNETGARQPIEKLSQITSGHDIIFHVDAVQALGHVVIDVKELNIDAVTFSAHKIYGPKGCGAIYMKQGINTFKYNCEDEGLNVPYIVGFAKAAHLAYENLNQHLKHVRALRDRLVDGMLKLNLGIVLNGSDIHHPGIVNLYFPNMDGDSLVINFDFLGICISSGSACSSGAMSASHVLTAMGFSHEEAKKCIRMTIGDFTTQDDIDYVIESTRILLKGK